MTPAQRPSPGHRLRRVLSRLRFWTLRERALAAVTWVALRVLPPAPVAVVHGKPDTEGNAVEVVRALLRRYPGTVHWLLRGDLAGAAASVGAEPGRLVPVRVDTLAAFRVAWRAEVTFFTHDLKTAVRPPRSRLVVNVWHGDGPKRTTRPPWCASTVVVAATRLWGRGKQQLFGLREQDVALVGNPRLDSALDRPASATRELLGIGAGERLVAWLPTFRRGWDGRQFRPDDGALLTDVLGAAPAVPEGVVLLVKPHPFDLDDYSRLGARVLTDGDLAAVGGTPVQLLAACDALVSDASSAWVDYLAFDRPVGFMLPDLDAYGASRGYNVPDLRAVLPGPVLDGTAALSAFLADVRDGRAPVPSSAADAMARIGFVGHPPVADRLLDWLDDYQRARGRRPLFTGPAAA